MRSPQDIVSENNVMQNDEMKKEINIDLKLLVMIYINM